MTRINRGAKLLSPKNSTLSVEGRGGELHRQGDFISSPPPLLLRQLIFDEGGEGVIEGGGSPSIGN